MGFTKIGDPKITPQIIGFPFNKNPLVSETPMFSKDPNKVPLLSETPIWAQLRHCTRVLGLKALSNRAGCAPQHPVRHVFCQFCGKSHLANQQRLRAWKLVNAVKRCSSSSWWKSCWLYAGSFSSTGRGSRELNPGSAALSEVCHLRNSDREPPGSLKFLLPVRSHISPLAFRNYLNALALALRIVQGPLQLIKIKGVARCFFSRLLHLGAEPLLCRHTPCLSPEPQHLHPDQGNSMRE